MGTLVSHLNTLVKKGPGKGFVSDDALPEECAHEDGRHMEGESRGEEPPGQSLGVDPLAREQPKLLFETDLRQPEKHMAGVVQQAIARLDIKSSDVDILDVRGSRSQVRIIRDRTTDRVMAQRVGVRPTTKSMVLPHLHSD